MKLNVKVIAAVLGLVTMATVLAACTREVIKEVQVPQIVTETVVKEVPVEVVVEKGSGQGGGSRREVVREVEVPSKVVEVECRARRKASGGREGGSQGGPGRGWWSRERWSGSVEKVVEVEVASESAESSPSSSSPRPEGRSISKPVELSAGEVDDNERWEDYLEYRDSYRGPRVHDVDVSERYVISVVDAHDRPVPNAIVRVSAGEMTIFEGRTYANGQSLFFPLAFPQAKEASAFRLYVEKDGVSQYLDATRYEESEWAVKLDVDQDNPRSVPLDVLFLLDSTGSMADEIDQVKNTLLSVSERIHSLPSEPDLRFGMVTYRDRGDEYITRTFDFDRDVQQFLHTIREVHADNGGDYPESVNEALHEAVRGPSWRSGDAIRLVFMIADAPPHLDYPQDKDYAEEMIEAHRRGIKVFTIASSGLDDQGEYIFRQISQHTMGRFIFIVYGSDGLTPHHVGQYTVQQLDDLVVRLVEEELSHLVKETVKTRIL